MTDLDLARPTAEDAAAAAKELATATGADRHEVAVVLGSGWAPAADALGSPDAEVRVADLTGFAAPTAEGHGGTVRSLTVGGHRTLVFLGRTHLYEGRGTAAVAHGVRVAAAAGCRHRGAHQRGRRAAPGDAGRPAGADLRPPQPDRPLAAGGRPLRRPHRPLLAAAAGAGPQRRPEPGGGRLRGAARTALRDPGRDPDAARARCRPGRHVHGAGSDRRRGPRASRCSASRWSPTSPPG